MSSGMIPVHVEVCLVPNCQVSNDVIRSEVVAVLQMGPPTYHDGTIEYNGNELLSQCVSSMEIVDLDDSPLSNGPVSFWQGELNIHVIRLSEEGPEQETIDGPGGEEEINACDQWVLPARQLQGMWGSLVLEPQVKNQLLEYATSAMLFADRRVSKHTITWNRVVLLHGPPGTGKTSLCKALAHKLSIRLSQRFSMGQLLEINAHSLFSKWFSESGKLVQRLFEHITELADDPDCLVCILIDEVESLTAARSASMSGNEPSDAVRVVNAVLTQIDTLRARDNVLVLTTSNISHAIDLAFVDRADIKQYIGLPPAAARYGVLRSCLEELMRVGIVAPPAHIPPHKEVALWQALVQQQGHPSAAPLTPGAWAQSPKHCGANSPASSPCMGDFGEGLAPTGPLTPASDRSPHGMITHNSPGAAPPVPAGLEHGLVLAAIAEKAEGLSGRALRKLPFQAHAFFVQRPTCSLEAFLIALDRGVQRELGCRADLGRREAV